MMGPDYALVSLRFYDRGEQTPTKSTEGSLCAQCGHVWTYVCVSTMIMDTVWLRAFSDDYFGKSYV